MASDQIEYCGECVHLAKCREAAAQGKLTECKVNKE